MKTQSDDLPPLHLELSLAFRTHVVCKLNFSDLLALAVALANIFFVPCSQTPWRGISTPISLSVSVTLCENPSRLESCPSCSSCQNPTVHQTPLTILSQARHPSPLTPVWQKWHSCNMRWAGMLQQKNDQPETRFHFSVDYRNRYGILSAVNCSPSDQPKGLRRGYFFGGAE